MNEGKCRCGATPRDRQMTAVCRVPGCPYPEIAERTRPKARERDLRHDADSVRFGHAMLKCEGYAPACSDAGRCANGGRCFGSTPHDVAARMIEAMIPTDGHAVGVHFAYLRRVAELLRDGQIAL